MSVTVMREAYPEAGYPTSGFRCSQEAGLGHSQGRQAAGKRQRPAENGRARERLMQTESRSRRQAINSVPVQRALTMISFAARARFLTVL
jgi:hypothetical protein